MEELMNDLKSPKNASIAALTVFLGVLLSLLMFIWNKLKVKEGALRKKTTEFEALRKKTTEFDEALQKKTTEFEASQKKITELDEALKEKEKDIKSLNTLNSNQKTSILKIQEKKSALEKENSTLKEEYGNKSAELRSTNQKLESLLNQPKILKNGRKIIGAYQDEYDEVTDELSKIRTEIQELSIQNIGLEGRLARNTEILEQKNEEISKIGKRLGEKKTKIRNLKNELNRFIFFGVQHSGTSKVSARVPIIEEYDDINERSSLLPNSKVAM